MRCVCCQPDRDGRPVVCRDCLARYAPGATGRDQYPEWLLFLLRDYEREAKAEQRASSRTVRLPEAA